MTTTHLALGVFFFPLLLLGSSARLTHNVKYQPQLARQISRRSGGWEPTSDTKSVDDVQKKYVIDNTDADTSALDHKDDGGYQNIREGDTAMPQESSLRYPNPIPANGNNKALPQRLVVGPSNDIPFTTLGISNIDYQPKPTNLQPQISYLSQPSIQKINTRYQQGYNVGGPRLQNPIPTQTRTGDVNTGAFNTIHTFNNNNNYKITPIQRAQQSYTTSGGNTYPQAAINRHFKMQSTKGPTSNIQQVNRLMNKPPVQQCRSGSNTIGCGRYTSNHLPVIDRNRNRVNLVRDPVKTMFPRDTDASPTTCASVSAGEATTENFMGVTDTTTLSTTSTTCSEQTTGQTTPSGSPQGTGQGPNAQPLASGPNDKAGALKKLVSELDAVQGQKRKAEEMSKEVSKQDESALSEMAVIVDSMAIEKKKKVSDQQEVDQVNQIYQQKMAEMVGFLPNVEQAKLKVQELKEKRYLHEYNMAQMTCTGKRSKRLARFDRPTPMGIRRLVVREAPSPPTCAPTAAAQPVASPPVAAPAVAAPPVAAPAAAAPPVAAPPVAAQPVASPPVAAPAAAAQPVASPPVAAPAAAAPQVAAPAAAAPPVAAIAAAAPPVAATLAAATPVAALAAAAPPIAALAAAATPVAGTPDAGPQSSSPGEHQENPGDEEIKQINAQISQAESELKAAEAKVTSEEQELKIIEDKYHDLTTQVRVDQAIMDNLMIFASQAVAKHNQSHQTLPMYNQAVAQLNRKESEAKLKIINMEKEIAFEDPCKTQRRKRNTSYSGKHTRNEPLDVDFANTTGNANYWSVSENGVSSDGCSGWREYEDSLTGAAPVDDDTESGVDTSEMTRKRSLTEFLFRGINNRTIPSDLRDYKLSDPWPSSLHAANIGNLRQPTRNLNEFALADPAVKRDVVQSPRDAMYYRSVEPVSESLDMIRRQNDAQPGDAMPLFPANYYQQRRCEHPPHKHHKCNKCDNKCDKCGGQHCDCQERKAALPTSNSLYRDVNGNLISQEALKRNVRSLPKGTLNLEPSDTQSKHKDSMQESHNSVVKRHANTQYSNKLLKTETLVRQDASGKSFPKEMLKFELQYKQNKLKNKMKTGPYHVIKRDVELNPPYELLRRGNEEYSFKKRANTAVTRKVRTIPLEMLNFELDYKRQRLHEKKRQITPENQMINRDIKLYQPYYAMEPIESENGQSLNQKPEADTPYTQSSLDETPLDNDIVLKRETVNMGAVQTGLPRSAMDRSSRTYGQMASSADSETDDRDMMMQLPLHPLPSTGSKAEPTELKAETIDQNDAAQMEQHAESVEQNDGAELSDDHLVFQSEFQGSPVELNHVRKRNMSARYTARPVDRSFRSYGKKDLLDETEMVDRDIKMYQPFYALPTDGSEPSEQNTGGESSRVEQSTFKRSSNVNHRVRKRRAFRRSSRPRARIHPSTGRKESSEEAAMVDHDIQMYKPLYALPLAALDNVDLSWKNKEDEISGARTSPQEIVDRSYVNSRVQKRGKSTKRLESPNDSIVNLRGKRNSRQLTKSVVGSKNKTF